MKPVLLDLFCGAGGAAVGYHRAGFDVVGVDIVPQPDYPYDFIQADALDCTNFTFRDVDFVHASPPCQYGAAISKGTNAHLRHTYPDLYPQVLRMLERSGVPYVIENPDARPDVVLCGEMFGLKVIRHRRFELGGWTAPPPTHKPHRGRVAGMRHGLWFEGPYFAVYGNGGGKGTVAQWQDAMDIHWTSVRKSIAEAIPPAYTEWIGRQFISHLKKEQAA
jgi:DNA (cytosine-5)-methyltransferase 1